jgi:hypothetical protein
MSNVKSTRIYLVIGILFAGLMAINAQAPLGREKLLERKAILLKDLSFVETVEAIARNYWVNFSIEFPVDGATGNESKISFDSDSISLQKLLNQVCAQDPRYSWRIANNRIFFYPIKDEDLLVRQLLASQINRFSLPENATINKIRNSMYDFPEIREVLEKEKVSPFVFTFISSRPSPLNPRNSSRMVERRCFKEILDLVSDEFGFKGWSIGRIDNGKFLEINFSNQ